MIDACIPLSLGYSPVARPGCGAGNYGGAGSGAVAATVMRYSKTPASGGILTNYTTIRHFYPIAACTRYDLSLSEVPCALILF